MEACLKAAETGVLGPFAFAEDLELPKSAGRANCNKLTAGCSNLGIYV